LIDETVMAVAARLESVPLSGLRQLDEAERILRSADNQALDGIPAQAVLSILRARIHMANGRLSDAAAAGQEQNTTDYEDRLRQRIESIVASVVGAGHVRVQVAADMNYNHTSTTSESLSGCFSLPRYFW